MQMLSILQWCIVCEVATLLWNRILYVIITIIILLIPNPGSRLCSIV